MSNWVCTSLEFLGSVTGLPLVGEVDILLKNFTLMEVPAAKRVKAQTQQEAAAAKEDEASSSGLAPATVAQGTPVSTTRQEWDKKQQRIQNKKQKEKDTKNIRKGRRIRRPGGKPGRTM